MAKKLFATITILALLFTTINGALVNANSSAQDERETQVFSTAMIEKSYNYSLSSIEASQKQCWLHNKSHDKNIETFRDEIFDKNPDYRNDVVIVKLKDFKDLSFVASKIEGIVKNVNELRLALIELPDTLSVQDAINILNQLPAVEYAEPNSFFYVDIVPNDSNYAQQWGLQKISAERAWDIERGSPSVTVAIIDTGVDWNHPDLAANIWTNPREIPNNGLDDDGNGYLEDIRGWDFVMEGGDLYPGEDGGPPDNDPMDFAGHGTYCAGIVSAVTNNNVGVAGVTWNCKIMPVRVGYKSASGIVKLEAYYVVSGILYAANNHADIISMSWSGRRDLQSVRNAIDYAYSRGCILVGSMGNLNSSSPRYPAAYNKVIAVSATGVADEKTWFSDYGTYADVAAPGQNIHSTFFDDTYTTLSGTSASVPFVSGVAALVLSKNPTFNNEDVRRVLRSSTDPVQSNVYIGAGRINAFKALQINYVPYAEITDPTFNDNPTETFNDVYYKNITITGSAYSTNFNNFTVSCGIGPAPTNWVVINQSTTQINNGVLCVFDTTLVPDGWNVIRLNVTDTQGNYAIDEYPILVDNIRWPDQSGWPVKVGEGIVHSSPIIGNLDGDGDLEVVIAVDDHKIYAWHHNGSLVNGWPKSVNYPVSYWGTYATPALGDLDNDGTLEIVIPSYKTMYAWHYNGTNVSGWPITLNEEMFEVSLGDMDNDGYLEVITGGKGPTAHVYAFNYDGTLVDGWPVPFCPTISNWRIVSDAPALADLNNDGFLEIIVSGYGDPIPRGRICVYTHNGTVVDGWPKIIGYDVLAAPVVGDINNDGFLEIIGADMGGIYVWSPNGTILPGWPVATGIGWVGDATALGDLEDDGFLEVIIGVIGGNYAIFVWDYNGTNKTDWPMLKTPCSEGVGPPVVGDIYGDADVEIIVAGLYADDNNIYAWHTNGTLVELFPMPINEGVYWSTPAIGDIDNDGDIEIVLGTNRRVYMWDLPTAYNKRNIEWPMFQHDARHTGLYNGTTLQRIAGDRQVGVVNTTLSGSFVVRAVDQFGRPVPNAKIFWVVADKPIDSTVEAISSNFTLSDANGFASVAFHLGEKSGIYKVCGITNGYPVPFTVTAAPDIPVKIDVIPNNVSIRIDETYDFNATGWDRYGNTITNLTPSWDAESGLITADGLYIPSEVGVWKIYANQSGASGSATVTVLPGPLHRIEITPKVITTPSDKTVKFNATGYDRYSNAFPIQPNWEVTNGWIDRNGTFYPNKVGIWTVYANLSNVSGFATVIVTPGNLTRIEILPNEISLTTDETVDFDAVGFDRQGNEIAITPWWEAENGTIDTKGLFRPYKTGQWKIFANLSEITGTANVFVTCGILRRVVVTPPSVVLHVKNTFQFDATGYDRYLNEIPNLTFEWSSNVGEIDEHGFFVAGTKSGEGYVFAVCREIVGKAKVTINAGALSRIAVSPIEKTITADEWVQFSAVGYDVYGNAVLISPEWDCEDGTIDSTGLFYPWRSGEWFVYANASNISGWAKVIVKTGEAIKIAITPIDAKITADKILQFGANGFDSKNNLITDLKVNWAVENGDITQDGLFVPRNVGRWKVYANTSVLSASTTVTVVNGSLSKIAITPDSIAAYKTEKIQFCALGYDAKGNLIDGLKFRWVVKGGVGNIDGTGVFTATNAGNGIVIATNNSISGFADVNVLNLGLISGKVVDNVGNNIEGATVSLGYYPNFTVIKTVITNASGGYIFYDLWSGNYTISVTKSGYEKTRKDISLRLGEQKIGVDFVLVKQYVNGWLYFTIGCVLFIIAPAMILLLKLFKEFKERKTTEKKKKFRKRRAMRR